MATLLLPQRRKQRYSLTALIDVVFILLMFFMLTSSFTRFSAVAIHSNLAAGPASVTQPQMLHLSASGQLRRHGKQPKLQPLQQPPQKRESATGNPGLSDAELIALFDRNAALVLMPAADAQVQRIVDALGRLQELGFARVTLGQLPPGTETGATYR